ncbi:hypothetical protein [Halotalea alkalilenta]|uniref:hypothetical protein n=1 Tax=Halotalea alkalilenta TaxID=376489 RepID=UPI0012DEA7A1|nr:hypothetical protein [Halotalea alkalilenta]
MGTSIGHPSVDNKTPKSVNIASTLEERFEHILVAFNIDERTPRIRKQANFNPQCENEYSLCAVIMLHPLMDSVFFLTLENPEIYLAVKHRIEDTAMWQNITRTGITHLRRRKKPTGERKLQTEEFRLESSFFTKTPTFTHER